MELSMAFFHSCTALCQNDTEAIVTPRTSYRYYEYIVAISVTILLCANLIGPAKVIDVAVPFFGTVAMSAGIVLLPLFYTLGKVVEEVYGHQQHCRLIWTGFIALAFTALLSLYIVGVTPTNDAFNSDYQKHLVAIFGNTPRIILASLAAFLCGSFVNGHVMAALKTKMQSRHLLIRTLGTTVCAELIDTCLFYTIAFYGIWQQQQIVAVICAQFALRIACGFIMSPVTYAFAGLLREKEQANFADNDLHIVPLRPRSPLGSKELFTVSP
jgi:uncharacterized integral membrane protein (TIGR00697 family)